MATSQRVIFPRESVALGRTLAERDARSGEGPSLPGADLWVIFHGDFFTVKRLIMVNL